MRPSSVAAFASVFVLGWSACQCGGAEPIQKITVKLRVTPDSLDFGDVPVGSAVKKTVTLVNSGNGAYEPDASHAPALAGDGFVVDTPCTLPLAPGAFCEASVSFEPQTEGDAQGTFTVHPVDGTADLVVTLHGHGAKAQIVVDPPALDFGTANVGDKVEKTFTVTNQGDQDTTGTVNVNGNGFFAAGGTSALTLAKGASTTVAVSFSPSTGGAANGAAVVEICGAGCGPHVTLTGVATAPRIDVEPRQVQFGDVAAGAPKTIDLAIANTGAGNLVVTNASVLASTTDVTAAFDAGTTLPLVIAQGASAPLHVTYAPSTPHGALAATLRIDSNDPVSPSVLLPIDGDSPGAAIDVVPHVASLGVLDAGDERSIDVVVRSIGTVAADVTSIGITGTGAASFAFEASPPVGTLEPGESVLFSVRATASAADVQNGGAQASVVAQATGAANATLDLAFLSGTHGCQPRAVEDNLNLGSVVLGQGSSGTLLVQNVGDAPCTLDTTRSGQAAGFEFDAGWTFSLAKAQSIVPGGTGGVDFAVQESAAGQSSAFVTAAFLGAPAPLLLSATARGVTGTLVGEPPLIDIGPVLQDCGSPQRTATFINAGGDAVTISAFAVDPPTAPFSLAPPPLPQVLSAGQAITIPVTALTTTTGTFPAELKATSDAVDATIRLNLVVDAQGADVTETFTANDVSQVDVLFVVDNSGSMADNQQILASNFDNFISTAFSPTSSTDFHLGVTTTGVLDGSGGPLVGPFLVRGNQATLKTQFEAQANVGTDGSGIELGLEGMRRALSDDAGSGNNAGFYRPSAALSVIIVGDEDDNGGDAATLSQIDPSLIRSTDTYVEFLRGLKGGNLSNTPIAVSTACTVSGGCDRYGAVANAFNGIVVDISDPSWGTQLAQIGAATFGLQRLFRLGAAPQASTVTVTVNGQATTDFTVSGNDVILGHDPPAHATVVISYQPGCAP